MSEADLLGAMGDSMLGGACMGRSAPSQNIGPRPVPNQVHSSALDQLHKLRTECDQMKIDLEK
eukprot:4474962-Pyramimonas_sp.AAC.1